MSKRRKRLKKIGRRSPSKDVKPVILIVCEGEVTEKQYLQGFANAHRNRRVDIEIYRKSAGAPTTLVKWAKEQKRLADENAISEKDDNLRYDAVWAVFDVDAHQNIKQAIESARDNGIELAISNPCFEIWLWFHFAEQPGMIDRKVLRQWLKTHVKNYDKHVDYSVFEPGYYDAVRRAKPLGLHDDSSCQPGPNPSTGIYVLTELIRETSNAHFPKPTSGSSRP